MAYWPSHARTLGLAEATFQVFILLAAIPTPVFSLLSEQVQAVADVCGCNVLDSQALLKCLREKASLELLNLGKVRRDGKICVGNSEDGSGQTLYLFYLF